MYKLLLYTFDPRTLYYPPPLYISCYILLYMCILQSKAFAAFLTELLHPFKRIGNYCYIYQHIVMLLAAIINDDPSMPALLNHFYDEGVLTLVLSVATQV